MSATILAVWVRRSNASETPSDSQRRKRSWGWITIAGVLAAEVASQQKEIAAAQETRASVAAAAKVAYQRKCAPALSEGGA